MSPKKKVINRFTLFVSFLGVAIILFGISRQFFGGNYQDTIVMAASGVVVEIISALFFSQSIRANKDVIDFFEKLRGDMKFSQAFGYIKEIPDVNLRNLLQSYVALKSAGADVEVDFIEAQLSDYLRRVSEEVLVRKHDQQQLRH